MPRSRQVTPYLEAEFVRLYESGQSAATIAAEYGTTPATVLAVLRNGGVAIRAAGRPRGFASSPEEQADIISRHQAGEPMIRIAEDYDARPASVWQFLNARGLLQRRNRSRPV